jgi:hypothetical protein
MTWPTHEALTYSHCILACPPDPNKVGTTQLARAYIELHDEVVRLRLTESDRLILQTLAWDRNACEMWPETCQVIQKWTERNRP